MKYLSILGFVLIWLTRCDAKNPYAMIVTLAGKSKLSSYFEWTCRTIGHAASKFDMLVFHESNARLKEISCANNVKFIDLGENGMSKLIVTEILSEFNSTNEGNRGDLINMLSEVMIHIPRYLIEVKPMSGSLFREYLTEYTHWTYTDPDIIWGNVANWIDPEDANTFDIITLAKTNDAGRLFIRGQFALHKNIDRINLMWKDLFFFAPSSFAARVTTALRMVRLKKSSDAVFQTNFHSAEGYYSQLVFKKRTLVKIIGRGFDDFNKDPVVVNDLGQLSRFSIANVKSNLKIMMSASNRSQPQSVLTLPPIVPMQVKTYYHKTACYMQWLPTIFRYCIATPVFSRGSTSTSSNSEYKIRLLRLTESFTLDGVTWQANDDKLANRQIQNGAAMFHFRHWDDFCSTGLDTIWPKNIDASEPVCMVVYIRADSVLSFENCASLLAKLEAGLVLKSPKEVSSGESKQLESKNSATDAKKSKFTGKKTRKARNNPLAENKKSKAAPNLRGSEN